MSTTATFDFTNIDEFTAVDAEIISDQGKLALSGIPAFAPTFTLTGISQSGDDLTKTAGGGDWANNKAVSSESLSADGYVEFKAGQLEDNMIFGLTADTSSILNLNFGMYCLDAGRLGVFENGVLIGEFDTYATTDTLRVEVAADVVTYKKNGSVIYTSLITPTYPLYVLGGMYQVSASMNDIVMQIGSGSGYPALGSFLTVEALSVRDLLSFSAVVSEPTSTSVTFALKLDGVLKYWSGSAWINSDGTFAQTNSASVINANIASIVISSNEEVMLYALLKTSDSRVTPSINSITVQYDFGGIAPYPLTCLVYGYLRDISDTAIAGATVMIAAQREANQYKAAGNIIVFSSISVLTDANGYFSFNLIRSSEFDSSPGNYVMTISKRSSKLDITKLSGEIQITFLAPDSATKNITDLITSS